MTLTEVIDARLGETRAASTANGGTLLSTAAVLVQLFQGTEFIEIIPREFTTAVVVKFALNPYLTVWKTPDALVTFTDYSVNAQDGDTSTLVTLSSLDTLANGDSVWIGMSRMVRGLRATVVSANSNASVLSAHYWNGTALTTLSPTDGTASGGATFAITGDITWTVPTAWVAAPIATMVPTAGDVPLRMDNLYWVRLTVSAALDSSTTLSSLLALNRSTAYAELASGYALQQRVVIGPGGLGCIEALTDAGTARLIVNCQTTAEGRFI